MSYRRPASRNLWALTVLCLLWKGSMHPYEIQRLMHERRKDELFDLRRGSLYHAIEQLQRGGLIEVVETSREGRRPERTIYRLTEQGRQETVAWLSELLAQPTREPSQFLAAVGNVARLTPAVVLEALQARAHSLQAELTGMDAHLQRQVPRLDRVLVLEAEYARAMMQAELAWVRCVIDDLRSGRLAWDYSEIARKYDDRTESVPQVDGSAAS